MSKTLRELAQAARGIAWSWWTSNSTLRLTSDRGSKDGDVLSAYRSADGVANIDCPEQYRDYIEAASPAAVLNLHAELDRVTAERDALQQRLNAADQRIDELESGRGEPIYQVRTHGSGVWEDISGESLEMCQCQPEEYEIRKLYIATAAPVAVVLPEKMEIPENFREVYRYRNGWNDCLASTTALNTPK